MYSTRLLTIVIPTTATVSVLGSSAAVVVGVLVAITAALLAARSARMAWLRRHAGEAGER